MDIFTEYRNLNNEYSKNCEIFNKDLSRLKNIINNIQPQIPPTNPRKPKKFSNNLEQYVLMMNVLKKKNNDINIFIKTINITINKLSKNYNTENDETIDSLISLTDLVEKTKKKEDIINIKIETIKKKLNKHTIDELNEFILISNELKNNNNKIKNNNISIIKELEKYNEKDFDTKMFNLDRLQKDI